MIDLLSKGLMIFFNGILYLMSLATFIAGAVLIYIMIYNIRNRRANTEPFEKEDSLELAAITAALGFACIIITAFLLWVAIIVSGSI